MCKSEIFAKIINIVSKETEVSVDQILSSETRCFKFLIRNLQNANARMRKIKL